MDAPTGSNFWVITSYFNPMRYKRRLSNFNIFRKRLNVPLVAVELTYGSDFQLQDQDADILIRLRGGAVLWQKERLLNLALQALPKHCRKVAWVDCDVLFGAADWAEAASQLLDRFAIIQMFQDVHYLSPHWTPVKDCTSRGGAYAAVGHLLHRIWSGRGNMHWPFARHPGRHPCVWLCLGGASRASGPAWIF